MKKTLLYCICLGLLSCGYKKNKIENSDTGLKKDVKINTQITTQMTAEGYSYDNDVSTLGIGLVIVPDTFKVYDDSLLITKPKSYDMYHDDEKTIDICPKFFKPDYGIMHFVCISSTQKAYKVLVNYNESKYLPKTKAYVFKSWNEYIMSSFGIRRSISPERNYTVSHQPLRKQFSEKSDTLSIPSGYEMFCPVEIKGDWLRVKFDCFYNDENNKHEGEPCYNYIDKCKNPVSGWFKWRDGNKLLIDIFLEE